MQAIAHTPTNKLENSIDFYQKLGFQKINTDGAILFTDGQLIIEINPEITQITDECDISIRGKAAEVLPQVLNQT